MIIEWDDFWLKCIAILVSGFIHFRRLIYVTRYLKLNIIRGESNFDVEHVLRLSLSKYSNENTEGQREEGFHVNSNWTWVKSKHSLSYIKLRLRVLIGSGWLSQQARAKYRVKKKPLWWTHVDARLMNCLRDIGKHQSWHMNNESEGLRGRRRWAVDCFAEFSFCSWYNLKSDIVNKWYMIWHINWGLWYVCLALLTV